MTAFYMFRLYSLTFLGNYRGHIDPAHPIHESPLSMTFPLIVLAVLSVVGGFIGIPAVFAENAHWLEHFLAPVFQESNKLVQHAHLDHATEYMLMGISTVLVLIMILVAVKMFGKQDVDVQKEDTGIKKWMANKWYVDELYQAVIIQPLHIFSVLLKNIVEKNIIDGAVNGVGKLVHYGARQFRLIQSGQVGNYLLFMILSIVVFLLIWFNDATIIKTLNNIF